MKVFTRSISTTRPVQAYTKKVSDSGKGSVFKRGTPAKSKGWITNFKETSAYSRLGREAPRANVKEFGLNNMDEQIMKFPSKAVRSLGVFGSFKRNQRHELFKDKTTLIRKSTSMPMKEFIANGAKTSSSANKMCLLGDMGVGKSTLVAQAQAMAILNGYVVLPIPRARELVSGYNDAVWSEKFQQFTQPMYARQWIKRVGRGNKAKLQSIEYKGKSAANVHNLYEYMMAHKNGKDVQEVMENIMTTLEEQPIPVLFTLDDVNIFTEFTHSANVDIENKPIYHGQLQFPKLFLDYMSGARKFTNGAVIASTTGANKISDTIPAGLGFCEPPAYAKIDRYDPQLASCLKGAQVLNVERYNQQETEKSIEYWHNVKVIPGQVDQTFIDQKYVVSGNGNARALLAACTQLY